jgi:hypothetical protein
LRDASAGNRAFLPDLAKALTNHGAMARDSAEAVRSLDEAVGIHRGLAAGNDAFRPDLAASLDNLASALAEAGRTGDALAPALEAVEIRRRLAAARPSTVSSRSPRRIGRVAQTTSSPARSTGWAT